MDINQIRSGMLSRTPGFFYLFLRQEGEYLDSWSQLSVQFRGFQNDSVFRERVEFFYVEKMLVR